MPTIFFSSKLFKILNLPKNEVVADETNNIFGSWNSNVFYLKGKKFLIFTNKRTLYSLVIVNFSVGEFPQLNHLLYSTIILQLKADGLYSDRRADLFQNHFSKIIFAPTDNDRPVIGSMNDFISQFVALYQSGNPSAKDYQKGIVATFLNEMLMGKLNYSSPIEEMKKIFSEIGV